MTNNVLVKYSGGSNRRAISLGAFIEVRAAADAAVANLKAAVRSYTDLVRSGVAGDCDVRCVSDCLHLSAVNRLVARIREAQAVAPGALRRLAEVGLDVAVDAETKRALALRPADFVRVDHEWLDTASCAEVEAAARALGVRSPTGKDSRYHVTWLARAGVHGGGAGARPRRVGPRLLPLRGHPLAVAARRRLRLRRPPGRPQGIRPGRRLARRTTTGRAVHRGGLLLYVETNGPIGDGLPALNETGQSKHNPGRATAAGGPQGGQPWN